VWDQRSVFFLLSFFYFFSKPNKALEYYLFILNKRGISPKKELKKTSRKISTSSQQRENLKILTPVSNIKPYFAKPCYYKCHDKEP